MSTKLQRQRPTDGAASLDRERAYCLVESVSKSFGGREVLHDVSIRVEEGELLCLLGPSGCGKTTLLNIIAGVVPSDAGVVSLAGREITHTPIQKRNIGFVFQSYALFPHMSVAENVAFGLRVRKATRAEAEVEVARLLSMVGLEGRGGHRPHQLSGGEQQRVALARALAVQPRLLLLDEPFSNLDAALRTEMRAELKRIQRETSVTTIMVTHDQTEAFEVADHIALMRLGHLVQFGTPHELYEVPSNEFAARFVGDANIFHGPTVATADGSAISYAGREIPVTDPPSTESGSFVLRPERARMYRAATVPRTPPGSVALPGRIREARYRGSGCRYVVAFTGNDGSMVVWHSDDRVGDFSPGDDVVVMWKLADAFVLPVASGEPT